jgi:acyl-CoA hydrolase
MHVDVASRAPHGRKHGATFAESWTTHDGTTIVAVGAVLGGKDPIAVGDLLKVGARTVVTTPAALHEALVALDRLVTHHGREHRDDELAASLVLVALHPDGKTITVAGAGRLAAIVVAANGSYHVVHGRAGALGTGVEPEAATDVVALRHDDLVAIATAPVDPEWLSTEDRSADALVHRIAAPEASVAVMSP